MRGENYGFDFPSSLRPCFDKDRCSDHLNCLFSKNRVQQRSMIMCWLYREVCTFRRSTHRVLYMSLDDRGNNGSDHRIKALLLEKLLKYVQYITFKNSSNRFRLLGFSWVSVVECGMFESTPSHHHIININKCQS